MNTDPVKSQRAQWLNSIVMVLLIGLAAGISGGGHF